MVHHRQILIGLVVILLLHSMLVIYSLLLSNTEEKTYEYGMLRALGLRHNSLIQLLTIQVCCVVQHALCSHMCDVVLLQN
jgi:ABC-type antimicrobial peptide transport system permease subunit